MKSLRVDELAAFAAARQADSPVLLDVREPYEIEVAALNVPGLETVCIPMDEVLDRPPAFDPSRPIVCLCHHGRRSAIVAGHLHALGLHDVYNLTGGIDAWSRRIDPSVPLY